MAHAAENLPESLPQEFEALSLKEQEESRLNSRDQEDKLKNILLHICSWNPDADDKLNADLKKKCLYGTLGAMMPHVAMLQETIWVYQNFLNELKSVEPDDQQFAFTGGNWVVWGIPGSKAAAIVYNSKKFKVEENVASAVLQEWREMGREVQYGLGDRTVALQGEIQDSSLGHDHGPNSSQSPQSIIFISIHMFFKRLGYTDVDRIRFSDLILAKAQILSNNRGLPVIIGADWNISVEDIELPGRAIMACPESLESSFEDDGIDAIIMLTPEKLETNISLKDVAFFVWKENVKAEEMNGLEPEVVDGVYRRGGKHRPIVGKISSSSPY